MKNKLILLLYLSFSFTPFFSYSQEYFEGEVSYKVDYKTLNENIPKELLIKEIGDTIVAYIKEDKYAMVYNSSTKLGNKKVIVDLREKLAYINYENLDTIYRYSLENEPGNLKLFRLEKEIKEILGNTCKSISIDYEPKEDSYYIRRMAKYFFSEKFPLNPKLYENHKEGFWNLYSSEAKAISLRNEITYYPAYRSIQEAFKIIPKTLNSDLFTLEIGKEIKNIEN